MKKEKNYKQVEETQDPEIEQNVHVRILQYLNGAKKPQDLVVLPENEQEVLIDPERRRKRHRCDRRGRERTARGRAEDRSRCGEGDRRAAPVTQSGSRTPLA